MTDPITIARRCLPLIDLTSLNEQDTPAVIHHLCDQAATRFGPVAAVCVYPEHVHGARTRLDSLGASVIRVATVVNFPDGSHDAARAERETRRAVSAGADEIDLVFPWRAFLAGDSSIGIDILQRCRKASAGCVLKVILETGELKDPELIRAAADMALAEGADFLKTSTGKTAVSATPESAQILLQAVQDSGHKAGVKVAGGVRRVADAGVYLALADEMFGPDWVRPAHFRFGASALLADVLSVLNGGAPTLASGY